MVPRGALLLGRVRVQTKGPGAWEHPGPLGSVALMALKPALIGASAPHVNAAVPQAQEPQGLARNNNSNRTPYRSRTHLYLEPATRVKRARETSSNGGRHRPGIARSTGSAAVMAGGFRRSGHR